MTRERISFAVPEDLTTHNTTYLFPQVTPYDYTVPRTLSIKDGSNFCSTMFFVLFIIRFLKYPAVSRRTLNNVQSFKSVTRMRKNAFTLEEGGKENSLHNLIFLPPFGGEEGRIFLDEFYVYTATPVNYAKVRKPLSCTAEYDVCTMFKRKKK